MIHIAQKFRPFSHVPGAGCLIPATEYYVQAFPGLIRIQKLSGEIVKEVELDIEGPLKQFTLLQDLERGCVTVFSEQYRCHILPDLEVLFRKNPALAPLEIKEKLSLGSHKQQNWESIKRRCDFNEIFPLWFRLGSLLQLPPRKGDEKGVFSLLEACKQAVFAHQPQMVIPAFHKLFLAGFRQMLVPRLVDEEHQGIMLMDEDPGDASALYILEEGARLIRSLFILTCENEISILPNLPPQFFAGRMLHLECPPFGTVDLEWSKKTIRRMHFHAAQDGEVLFHFNPELTQFRAQGKQRACGDWLEIKAGSHYLLDQFQK